MHVDMAIAVPGFPKQERSFNSKFRYAEARISQTFFHFVSACIADLRLLVSALCHEQALVRSHED